LRRISTALVAASLVVLLGGSSPTSCDGSTPAGTVGAVSYVNEACDTDANGKFPPGCPQSSPNAPNGDACGNAGGQCPCQKADNATAIYCGVCTAHAPLACTYCPQGTQCPTDPCGTVCPPAPVVKLCPSNMPVNCNGACCPSDYPICCQNLCANTQAACTSAMASNNNNNNNNNGGGSCGIPPGGCAAAGLSNAHLRTGCCSTTGCLGSCTDSCYSWYEVGNQLYGPCTVGDNSCLQNAAQAATNAAQSCI
jgi:hypothetical protein